MNDNHNRIILILILMVLTAVLTTVALRMICDKYMVETYYGVQHDIKLRDGK